MPIKATIVESIGDKKFKVNLSQEGDDIIAYKQLMDIFNRGEGNGKQGCKFQEFSDCRRDPNIPGIWQIKALWDNGNEIGNCFQ